MYKGQFDVKDGAVTIEGVRLNGLTTKQFIQKSVIKLTEELKAPDNQSSSIYLGKTTEIFGKEMAVELSFYENMLKMIVFEPAELFNRRNQAKLSGWGVDHTENNSAFLELRDILKSIMNGRGENVNEDNVRYYMYEKDQYGIMAINDKNLDRVSITIVF